MISHTWLNNQNYLLCSSWCNFVKLAKEKDIQLYIHCQLDPANPYSLLNPATSLSHSRSSSQSDVPCLPNAMFCFSDFSSLSRFSSGLTFWDCSCPNCNCLWTFLFAILLNSTNPLSQAPYSILVSILLLPLQQFAPSLPKKCKYSLLRFIIGSVSPSHVPFFLSLVPTSSHFICWLSRIILLDPSLCQY